jgi:hypothetical protein
LRERSNYFEAALAAIVAAVAAAEAASAADEAAIIDEVARPTPCRPAAA